MCMGRPKNIIVVNKTYRTLAETYYRYLLRIGYNAESCQSRKNYLEEFLHWLACQGHPQIEKISPTDIVRYYNYISERPSKQDGGLLNQKTTHSHMRNIRKVFCMLQEQSEPDGQPKIITNPTSGLKFPYPKETAARNILDQQEIQALYIVSETAQERAILSLAYGCGLRVGELTNCNIEDIRLREKILIVTKGKGNKRRVVPLSSGVAKDLAAYYYQEREGGALRNDPVDHFSERASLQRKDAASAFMLNSRGRRMRKGTYNKHLKILIERTQNQVIKEKQITIHNLRHSIATHLLEQGIPVEQVRVFLGHSQLETTQIYTHISSKQIENLMQ